MKYSWRKEEKEKEEVVEEENETNIWIVRWKITPHSIHDGWYFS